MFQLLAGCTCHLFYFSYLCVSSYHNCGILSLMAKEHSINRKNPGSRYSWDQLGHLLSRYMTRSMFRWCDYSYMNNLMDQMWSPEKWVNFVRKSNGRDMTLFIWIFIYDIINVFRQFFMNEVMYKIPHILSHYLWWSYIYKTLIFGPLHMATTKFHDLGKIFTLIN